MEPLLVREVRSRDGRVEKAFEPRVVRRVIPEQVAQEIRDVLVGAVEEGTGQEAGLGPFQVAGKTGTARIARNGRYTPGAYTASFAGFFPAKDPQLVFIVKLDQPRGAYYGGRVAAPVTRATLEAALATRNSPIDRSAVARAATATRPEPPPVLLTTRASDAARSMRLAATLHGAAPDTAATLLGVPDVTGMPMRDGVRRLHLAGFRVQLEGRGRVARTIPSAGDSAATHDVIRVIGEASRE
jgi:membrane peptidoglycan carboxypeptidase